MNSIFLSLLKHITVAINCAKIVAIAAPSTPEPKMKIAIQSKATFKTEEIIIALSGVLLSPRALSVHAHILYPIDVINPPKIIYPYNRQSSIINLSVFSSSKALLRNNILNVVSTIVIIAANCIHAANLFRRSS